MNAEDQVYETFDRYRTSLMRHKSPGNSGMTVNERAMLLLLADLWKANATQAAKLRDLEKKLAETETKRFRAETRGEDA